MQTVYTRYNSCLFIVTELDPFERDVAAVEEVADHETQGRSRLAQDLHRRAWIILLSGRH